MALYLCIHCHKLADVVKKRGQSQWDIKCPFCGAYSGDLLSVKKCKIKIPKGAKHGDCHMN